MAAVHRVAVEGWSKEKALKEAFEGGFGFNASQDEVRAYFEGLDFERIRKDAGLR